MRNETRTFPKKVVEEACDGDSEELRLQEEGDWISECKYETCICILQAADSGKYYRWTITRSGSPFTDWYYDWQDQPAEIALDEVTRVQVMVAKWETVKTDG